MLENSDVEKLIGAFREIFPTKDEVASKSDFEDLKSDFRALQTSVDGYAAKVDTYAQEATMRDGQLQRHEKWHHQVAEKLDIKLQS